ncbi:MAG: NosD domain-containing protein [Planctomycetota bacterium]|jgi:parallel beta-helix repeat protein
MKKKHFYTTVILIVLLAVGIQPALATIYLTSTGWSDPTVGSWDSITKTATLETNVFETIQIDVEVADEADRVTLDGGGFTVTSSATENTNGVYVQDKSYVTIMNLTVQNFQSGINLLGCSYINLIGNTTSGNNIGINLNATAANPYPKDNILTGNFTSNNETGIRISNCDGFTLTSNTISSNTMFGIKLVSCNGTSTGNTITDNLIKDNIGSASAHAINLEDSSDFTLKNNTVSNNAGGIRISGISSGNTIYNNNFIKTDNTLFQASVTSSGNVFNLDLPTGGNYWSDYMGEDTDGDGVGETAYTFNVGQDDFPWIIQNGWSIPVNQPPIADAGPDQTVEQDNPDGASVTLDGSGSSDDGQIQPLIYTWSWADGGSSTGVNPTVTLPVGTTTVTLTVYDGALDDTDTVDITVQSVEPPEDVVEDIIEVLENMAVPEEAEKEMGKAVKELNKAIKEFNKGKIDKAIKKIAKAVKELEKAQKKGADTQDVIDQLVDLVEGL